MYNSIVISALHYCATNLENSFILQNENLYLLNNNSSFPPPPSPWQTELCFLPSRFYYCRCLIQVESYSVFYDWLFSLSTMPSRFIYIKVSEFPFFVRLNNIVCLYTTGQGSFLDQILGKLH